MQRTLIMLALLGVACDQSEGASNSLVANQAKMPSVTQTKQVVAPTDIQTKKIVGPSDIRTKKIIGPTDIPVPSP